MTIPAGTSRQIPFSFGNFQQLDFASFIADKDPELISILKDMACDQLQQYVYLWGPAGSGKSHLIQAACRLASENQLQAAYVPLEHIHEFGPEMLHDLGMLDLVCVDSLEHIAYKKDWQQPMVWLYNELRDNGHSLLMAGQQSPQDLQLETEDLRSRLSWGLVFHIKRPDDDTKKRVLKQKAKERSFTLTDEVIDFLIHRVKRDLHCLIELLDKIDQASLAEQRKVTIPFIKSILEIPNLKKPT